MNEACVSSRDSDSLLRSPVDSISLIILRFVSFDEERAICNKVQESINFGYTRCTITYRPKRAWTQRLSRSTIELNGYMTPSAFSMSRNIMSRLRNDMPVGTKRLLSLFTYVCAVGDVWTLDLHGFMDGRFDTGGAGEVGENNYCTTKKYSHTSKFEIIHIPWYKTRTLGRNHVCS